MIFEQEGKTFECAISQAKALLSQAKGWRGFTLMRCIEEPQPCQAIILRDTDENHMLDFLEGPLFTEWRALVGPFFARPPEVLYFDTVATLPAP